MSMFGVFHGVRFENAVLRVLLSPEDTKSSQLAKACGLFDVFRIPAASQGMEAKELIGPVLVALSKLGVKDADRLRWIRDGHEPDLPDEETRELVRFGLYVFLFVMQFPLGNVFAYEATPESTANAPKEDPHDRMFSLEYENFALRAAIRRLLQEKKPGEDITREFEDFLFRTRTQMKIEPLTEK